jgi:hypothetical protein
MRGAVLARLGWTLMGTTMALLLWILQSCGDDGRMLVLTFFVCFGGGAAAFKFGSTTGHAE